MIPCTLRPRLLLNNGSFIAFNNFQYDSTFFFLLVLRNSLQKSATRKFYATDNHDRNTSMEDDFLGQDSMKQMFEEEIDREETKHFWEIDSKKRSGYDNRRKSPEAVHKDTRDFQVLLKGLFANNSKPSEPAPLVTPLNKKSTTVIEEKLLEMMLQNKKPYKPKAPLPRSAMAAMYAKTAERTRQSRQEQEGDDDILDFLNPSSTVNWNKQDVLSNESIQLKEKEMKTIQSIVDTTNELDLLQRIQKEINQDEYPAYYPNVLAKAIEHASLKDPYLALSIFEQAKNKSMTSYIMGCTTTVYNRLLMLRWDVWRDVYGMLDLVEEMTVNGIAYDNDSRRIIRSVVNEIESEGSCIDSDEPSTGVYWNAEERRNCHIMKELAGKWLITKV
jgi:hypothetical protein